MNAEEARRAAAGVLLPGFGGTALPEALAAHLRAGLAGVVLFGANVRDPQQVRALTDAIRAARPEAVVAIDEEGGDVTRLHQREGSPEPGNAVLGRLDDEALTAASAHAIGLELIAAGCTLDLAPTADANVNPDNPVIGARSFGADAALVARHTAAAVHGLQAAGVAACAKHFPGHGDTAVDSHLGLPVIDLDLEALRQRELLPFVAAIEAGVAVVMTSHIVLPRLDPDQPATMSRRILTGLLREELGFGGVVVSDALDMAGASGEIGIPAAAVRSLAAGADLLCLGTDSEPYLDDVLDAVVAAVAAGELPEARLREAADRVRGLADRTGTAEVFPRPDVRIADAFDVQPEAAAALRSTEGWTVVTLDAEPNIAVGAGSWGPAAAAAADPAGPGAFRFSSWPAVALPVDRAAPVPAIDGPVLVLGRDVHRRPHARAAVDALRSGGRTVVAVDMGWPAEDRRYADVATFGASRAVGAALLALLTGTEEPSWRS
ncbi:glycoside hydrolase family 3 protein [Amnibacterium soli]|uniref:Glycoside hydrolase family 3 protein n=1 Tax=Amnibacterium soli TaxID=1282736 RepID=A0ABP8YYY7_9MICO